jgi:ankyrin repeat protein
MQAVNRPDIIELLLSKGADANAQNYFGKTALMYAIQYQSNDAIKLLLKSGANIHLTTFDTKENWMLTSSCSGYALKAGKRTALMYAAWHATPEIVRLLIDKGANKSLKDTNGDSACNYIDKNESIAEQQRKDMQGILCDN